MEQWFSSGYKVRFVDDLNDMAEKISIFDAELKDSLIEDFKYHIINKFAKNDKKPEKILLTSYGKNKEEDIFGFLIIFDDGSKEKAILPMNKGIAETYPVEDFRELSEIGRVVVNQETFVAWFEKYREKYS